MRINLNTFVYHIVYFLTLISLFFLNNDRTSSNENLLNIILSFFTFIFILLLFALLFNNLYKTDKKVRIYILMCLLCCFTVLLIRSYVIIHWVYLLISLYVAKTDCHLNRKLVKVSIFLSFCSILMQLAYFRFFDGRPVLSYIDPNYSGYCIFCLFLFSWYSNCRKIAICLILCGLLTLSRNFILAILIFLVVEKISVVRMFILRFSYMKILLLGYIVLFIISSLYIARFADMALENATMEKDVTQMIDRSNLDRFTANILFIEDISENVTKYLWGLDLETYTNNVFRNAPHNSLLQLILNYGLFFSIFYICILSYIFRQYRKAPRFVGAYAALLAYFLLLGGGIYGIQVIWISFIYKSSVTSDICNNIKING